MSETKTGYPSIDKPWLQFYKEEELNVPPVECTVYERMYQFNKDHSADVAIKYFGNEIKYSSVFDQIEKCKKAFEKINVKAGDKVVLLTSATPELVYVSMALCRIGAVVDLINPLFEEEQIIARTNETQAQILFVLDQLYPKVAKIRDKLCVKKIIVIPITLSMSGITKFVAGIKQKKDISYSDNVIRWNDFLAMGNGVVSAPDKSYEKDYPFIMVYSSGTTGASKGIVLTNDGVNATISHYSDTDFPYKRQNTFLQMIPIWFSTGIVLSLLMPICLGITVAMEPAFSKENFAKDIKKYKPEMTLAATSLWLYAISCDELKSVNISNMTYPITGGEAVLPETEVVINEFLKLHGCKAPLIKGYGMCELGSTVSTSSPTHSKPGSTGYPISHVSVAAFDIETDEEKKYMERGEIRVMTRAHMKEYFMNPKATEEFFKKDDKGNLWGCTGDIGYVDEDGDIYIFGRANDCFYPTQGEKVYCFDVENIILEIEEIDQCEVVGIQNDDGTHTPVTHLILKDSCLLSEIDLFKKVQDKCKDNLSESSIPKAFKIVDAFPVKNNGKRDMELMKKDLVGLKTIVDDELVEWK